MKTATQIRYGTPADAEHLARFAAQTFTATYCDLDNAKDIADYVAEYFSVTAVADVLRDPACTTLLPKRARCSRAMQWSGRRNRRAV